MKMKLKHGVAVLVVALIMSACTNTKKEETGQVDTTTTTAEPAAQPEFNVDVKFQQQLGKLVASYVGLKDAFVASDPEKIKSAMSEVKESLAKIDMMLISGEAHNKWMEYMNGMDEALIEMSGVTDIEAQRGSFSMLTSNLYESLKAYGTSGDTIYYDFCPMAFDNKGAFWLSTTEAIRNPYFGDKMLGCGSIEEVIK